MSESWAALGVVFMGLGGVAAGLAGITLPEGRRLGALFALIGGAGVGIVVLGIGALLDETYRLFEFTFFLGSLLGFVAVCGALWLVRGGSPNEESERRTLGRS